MNCLNCNAPLANIDYCTNCGADMSILKRIGRLSNMNYNEGLDNASVRDLSGAIECLKRSLKFNKYNTQARNLLGLVYYETGEVVSALSEWVISKNLQPENNIADEYITKLQANPNKLNTINQTIRKYNQSLQYCQQRSDDMAIIQLKKVLAQNPKLIKGHQLLALLYIRAEKYEKARRILKKAARIDNTNTRTLRFIREVDEETGTMTSLEQRKGKKREKHTPDSGGYITYKNGNETIIQPTTFQETSIAATFINIILGLIVGAALIWFLVVPGRTQSTYADANKQVITLGERIAAKEAEVMQLEKQVTENETLIADANQKTADAQTKLENLETMNKMVASYLAEDYDAVITQLDTINSELLDAQAQNVYNIITDSMFTTDMTDGVKAYNSKDYATAITHLTRATDLNPEDVEAIRYLALSYYKSGDKENSGILFAKLKELDPDNADEYDGYLQDEE